jgi:phage tail sheath protein FI
MTYLSPGVYVEEVSSGSRPIEGVGTAVAAFVGLAEKGPLSSPILRVAAGTALVVLVALLVRRRIAS